MSIKTKFTMTDENAGRKMARKEQSKQSYSIYESAYTCPLRVYISVVCDKDYKALLIEGDADDVTLEQAFLGIMDEYAELCGGKRNQNVQNFYTYKSQILALDICLRLLSLGETKVVEHLNKIGLRCKEPKNEEEIKKLAIKIGQRIKDRAIRLRKVYKDIQGSKGKELEKKDFYAQLVSISRWAGYRVGDEITLAEYAIYVKQAQEEAERLKMDGKKH